jgi:hypothetical protein
VFAFGCGGNDRLQHGAEDVNFLILVERHATYSIPKCQANYGNLDQ